MLWGWFVHINIIHSSSLELCGSAVAAVRMPHCYAVNDHETACSLGKSLQQPSLLVKDINCACVTCFHITFSIKCIGVNTNIPSTDQKNLLDLLQVGFDNLNHWRGLVTKSSPQIGKLWTQCVLYFQDVIVSWAKEIVRLTNCFVRGKVIQSEGCDHCVCNTVRYVENSHCSISLNGQFNQI